MVFVGYDPVGKTLEEVLLEASIYIHGIAVFVLKDNEDTVGELAEEGFSLKWILKNKPELRTARVVSHNDFFGESVFRVRYSL